MFAALGVSFSVLLILLTIFEVVRNNDIVGWTESEYTVGRLRKMVRVMDHIPSDKREAFVTESSRCHEGYSLTASPYPIDRTSAETTAVVDNLHDELLIESANIRVGFVDFDRDDFAYRSCSDGEIEFPVDGIVISLQVAPNQWFNAEIHRHEWHITPTMTEWLLRSGTIFLLVGGFTFWFVRRLSKPLHELTGAAAAFGAGLEVAEVRERGPMDLQQAIASFNAMQKQVADEIERRTDTLAAIRHDVRTPLTALRVKAELIDDQSVRADLVASIDKMERITASALEFLKGESRTEPMRRVDLGALVESECAEFTEIGARVTFECPTRVLCECRPIALGGAVRNLVENAIKYAPGANVSVVKNCEYVEIIVSDDGPGIEEDLFEVVTQPFQRVSSARESSRGGFGLGLAIAKAVAEGHDGKLVLTANQPQGLIAIIRLPVILSLLSPVLEAQRYRKLR